jgi:hypothetical protein
LKPTGVHFLSFFSKDDFSFAVSGIVSFLVFGQNMCCTKTWRGYKSGSFIPKTKQGGKNAFHPMPADPISSNLTSVK